MEDGVGSLQTTVYLLRMCEEAERNVYVSTIRKGGAFLYKGVKE
jgi:hypothetical protein